MMRKITIDCGLCSQRVAIEHGKEAMFETGPNAYHLMDLCPSCLDDQLRAAESVNDTSGYRQKAAALLRMPDGSVPSPAAG
jgi:hypothetical protein